MKPKFCGIECRSIANPYDRWARGLYGGKRDLVPSDEPFNPFKSAKKPAPQPKKSQPKGRRNVRNSGPPAPPGQAKPTPPVAPTSTAKPAKITAESPRVPAQAGKGVGLRKKSDNSRQNLEKKSDVKARKLIDQTISKVAKPSAANPETKTPSKEPSNPFKKKGTARPQRRGGRGGKRNRPQAPTARVRKLHRGKYMEFKYDVRKILDEEGVADEHRSNVLGQTWAKGERQGVQEAKDFLSGKASEGIISEKCAERIEKLIKSLTTRR